MAVDIIARGMASSGGGGGVSDYNQLTNKPKINGVELTGDIDSSNLGLPQYDGDTINLNAESKMQTVGIKDQKTGGTDKFWTGTKAEYDALATHDENTFYAITDDSGETSTDVFVINLTEKATNPVTYSADKTHDEIVEAYNSNKIMVIRFDSSQLPMMNIQASGSDLGITFGYSQIQADGNLVITRAIHYLYTSDIEKWEDADEEFSESKAFDITITDENGTLSANKTDEEIKEAIVNKYIVRCFYHDDIYTLSYSDYDGDEFHFNNLSVNISGTLLSIAGVWSIMETNLLTNKGGEVTGNIDMTGNAITDASKIHVDGEAPIYIGSTIEKAGTSGSRMTGTTSGEVAFVKATTQSEYVPILIGEPVKVEHATTKGYVDDKMTSIFKNITGYDETKIQVLKNNQGTLTWVNES